MIIKKWIVFIALCLTTSSGVYAATLYVTNTANSGLGSLRDVITSSASGDRIIIDISGTISLNSTILIDHPIELIGPYPTHCTIDITNIANTTYAFQITSPSPVRIKGIKFELVGASTGRGAIEIAGTSTVLIEDCVFLKCKGSNGGAIFTAGITEIINSSFFQNTTSNEGGAVRVFNSSSTKFINCTFNQNAASSQGGAVRCEGTNLFVQHCTFVNNTSGSSATELSVAGNLSTTLHNNIFSNATLPNSTVTNFGGPAWINHGGNIFSASAGSITFLPSVGNLYSQSNAVLQLGAMRSDSYGMLHMPLLSGSVCINAGTTNILIPARDARRAPRIMNGGFAASSPDAGAFEKSAYTVTSSAQTGIGSFQNSISNIHTFTLPGPYYIDFNIGSVATIPAVNYGITTGIIVDGFTESTGKIGGPGVTPNSFSPPQHGITFDGLPNNPNHLLYLGPGSNGSEIYGLKIIRCSDEGINIDATDNIKILGNTLADNSSHGVIISNAFNTLIGDSSHVFTNIISGNNIYGVFVNASNTTSIYNNIIGPDPTGTGNFLGAQNVGIFVQGNTTNGIFIGDRRESDRGNLISGNMTHQILISDVSNNIKISGNFIGTDFSGSNLITQGDYGIALSNNSFNAQVGGLVKGLGNIIIGQGVAGIKIDNSGSNIILNNIVGFTTIPFETAFGNGIGIELVGPVTTNNIIGNPGSRNYFSGNLINGVVFSNGASSNNLVSNFIGLSVEGNPMGNGSHGVRIDLGASNNQIGSGVGGNVIGDNFGNGIFINSAGGNNSIMNNYIGLDTLGQNIRGNSFNGIEIISSPGTDIAGNYISGNGQHGIKINSDNTFVRVNVIGSATNSSNVPNTLCGIVISGSNNTIGGSSVQGNVIANNLEDGVRVTGAGSVNNAIMGNTIFENGGLGIDLEGVDGVETNDAGDFDTGPNELLNSPELIAATNCSGVTTISGVFHVSNPGINHVIEYYQIPAASADASGHGEGNIYLGSLGFLPGSVGPITIDHTILFGIPAGDKITATLSEEVFAGQYQTSEFGANIVVEDPPVYSYTPTNISCAGNLDGSIVATQISGSTPDVLTWMDGGGSSIGQNTTTASGLAADTYNLQVEDLSGCIVTGISITITEPSPITGAATFTPTSCAGTCDGSISLTGGGGTGTLLYSIDGGSTTFTTGNFTALCSGSYTGNQITDANGCLLNLASITIPLIPVVSISPSVTNETCLDYCDGIITVSSTGGTAPHSYSLDGITYSAASSFAGLCNGSYTMFIRDANGCDVNTPFSIGTDAVATPNFFVPSACVGSPITFTDLSTVTPGAVNNWQWTFPSGLPASSNTQFPTAVYSTAGTYNVQLISGSATCTDTIVIPVSVFDAPIVNVGPNDTTCFGSGYVHTVSIAGGSGTFNYDWQPSSHFVDNTIQNAVISPTLSTGTFNHTIIVNDVTGCQGTDTVQITILPEPDPSFTYSNTLYCPIGVANATINGDIGGTFSATPPGLSLNTSTGDINLATSSSGSFAITYSVSNNFCTADSTYFLAIIANEDPNVVYGANIDDTARFCLNGSNPVPSFIATPGGSFSSSTLSVLSTGEIDMSTATSGSHFVIYSTPNCGNIDSIFVIITNPPAQPSASIVNFVYCQGQTINPISINLPGNGEFINWYSDAALSNLVANGSVFTPPNGLSGVVNYYVTFSLANCEGIPLVITVTIIDGSLIDPGVSRVICPNATTQLNVTGAGSAVNWSPTNLVSDSTITNPLAFPTTPTMFYVSTIISGCVVTDSVFIDISTDPNCLFNNYTAFSPDGDGTNETWIIEAAFTYPENKVIIYNRWGDELVNIDNYNNVDRVWDGTYKGNLLPTGTYYYIIRYNEIDQQYSGWVQLMR